MRVLPPLSRGRACTTWICSGGFAAFGGCKLVAQLRLERGLVGLDEGIEPDAGAAVGERDNGGVADVRIVPDQIDQHRGIIDQPPAAAFAIGEIEQAARDGAVDFLAGREPDAGDKAICAPRILRSFGVSASGA